MVQVGVFLWEVLLKIIDQKITFLILAGMYPPFVNSTCYHGMYPLLFCHLLSIPAHSHQDVLFLELAMPLEEEVVSQGSSPHQGNVRETLSGPKLPCC